MINHGDMITERIIEGRRCRLCGNSRYSYSIPLWIAGTGDFAAYADNAGGVYCPSRILCDYGGPFIIERKNGGTLEQKHLEPLVLSTFGPAYDGMKLFRGEEMIIHRDGNYMNFASGNLEWVRQRDPRYKNYIQQKKEARRTRDRMLRGE